MSGAADTPRSHLAGFEETVKDFWVSRPRRPLHGRKVAGVAAGIGQRYGIDPVLVRVAFVTATIFGGIGLSLYLLGWLLFPGENDEVSPVEALFGRGRSSMSKAFTIVLAIVVFPISSWAFTGGSWFDGGAVIGLALMATALYLLHRSRGQDNRPPAPATGTTAAFSLSGETTEERTSGWDPLSAAPLGWDLPEPAPAPTPPPPPSPARRRNRKVGPATFGIALLVSGAGAALGASGVAWFSPPHIIGLALGVLGVGMVVGAFLRGGRGLIGWAVPLSFAGLVMTAVPVQDYAGGFGELRSTPLTAAEVLPVYQRSVGDIELDLTKLPAGTPVATTVHNGVGATTVLVPETADVRYSCEVRAAGDIDCFGKKNDGVNLPATVGTDLGQDGPGGPQITLTVTNGVGNVQVRRG